MIKKKIGEDNSKKGSGALRENVAEKDENIQKEAIWTRVKENVVNW